MYSNMKYYENICNCLRVIQQDINRKLKSANCWQQTSLRKLHRSKIFVVVSQRHREYRSTIAVASWPNNKVIRPRSGYTSATLCAILLRSVRSRYNLATTNAFPRRLCYLDIANLGASTTHSIEHKPVSFVGFIQKGTRIATERELGCKGRGRVAMA